MDGTSFQIDIAANAAGVDAAAAAVDRLSSQLEGASSAAVQAAEAVSAGEASYRAAENAADGAAKSLERIGLKALDLQDKMQAAMDAGDEGKFWKLARAADELVQQHERASARVEETTVALNGEAQALDNLRAAAKSAADQEVSVAKAHEQATKSLSHARSAADQMRASHGQLAESAGKTLTGLKKFGGPIGNLADAAEDSIEGFTKMSEEIGMVGTLATLSVVAVVALAAAVVGLAYGLGQVTFWAVKLADKEKRLDSITEKFKKHTANLFGGLKIKPLLDGVENLVDLFDETTVTGKAIKVVFESMFQPLVDGITAFIPKMRTAFIQFEILVLKALIAIKPFGSTIVFAAQVVWELAKAVLYGLAIGLGAAVVATLAFWSAMKAVASAVVDAYNAVVGFGKGVATAVTEAYNAVVGFGKGVSDYFANTSLEQIGIDMLAGLARGITGAGGMVVSALGGVVSGAIDSAKKALGIASPSKVFAEIGANTSEGMAVGVDSGTSDVQGALTSLVEPPAAAAQRPGSLESLVTPPTAGASASGGSGLSNVGGVTIILNGVQGAEDAIAQMEAALLRVLEGDAAQLGGAVPAT